MTGRLPTTTELDDGITGPVAGITAGRVLQGQAATR